MDDGWKAVEQSFAVDEANKVIDRINEKIAMEQATVDTLRTIIENSNTNTKENTNG
jgi:hypothetical protein